MGAVDQHAQSGPLLPAPLPPQGAPSGGSLALPGGGEAGPLGAKPLPRTDQHGQSGPLAVQLGFCASSGGRAWRLWAARHSQEEAGPLPPATASGAIASRVQHRFFFISLSLTIQVDQAALALKNLDRWARDERVPWGSPWGRSYVRREPKGVVPLIAQWNFPG